MTRHTRPIREMSPFYFVLICMLVIAVPVAAGAKEDQKRPNIVVLVADDLGIGDLGCYGNDTIKTPNIDKLASEGVRLTHHLATATICTPSRAAMLTGRYAARYGLVGEKGTATLIVHLSSQASVPPDEITIGRALAAANYTTAAVGKWHLGAKCGIFGTGCSGPHTHGFQDFYGIPLTLLPPFRGDQPFWIFPIGEPVHQSLLAALLISLLALVSAVLKYKWRKWITIISGFLMLLTFGVAWFTLTHLRLHNTYWWRSSDWVNKYLNSILMHNDRVIEQPIVLDGLMQNLVNYSVKFIEDHAKDENPFFLYHAFAHTHTPMFVHPSMEGRSKHGRYGDNVEEMDHGVGTLLDTLSAHDLDRNTIVYFVSDHGGHLESRDEHGQRVGGYNGLFKGGKGQGSSEGGIRVPGIYRWKGVIPASVSIGTPTSLMDMMPTILHLANIPPLTQLLPQQNVKEMDGISIANLLLKGTPMEDRIFLHHCRKSIHALRWAKGKHVYKMFLKRIKLPEGSQQCGWGQRRLCPCYGNGVTDVSEEPLLFDLSRDPYEDDPVPNNTSEYREVVRYLKEHLADWKAKVPYPPSQYRSMLNTIPSLWYQPFCLNC